MSASPRIDVTEVKTRAQVSGISQYLTSEGIPILQNVDGFSGQTP